MKAQKIVIQHNTLKVTFVYSTTINKVEIPYQIGVTFRLGKNKKANTVLRMVPEDSHFYCRLILRNIQEYFS